MMTLTGRERILRLLRGETIDRFPICPRVFQNVVYEYNGSRDIDFVPRMIDYYRVFGFDIIDWNCTPRPHFELEEFCREGPQWRPTVTERRGDQIIERTVVVETPKGRLQRTMAVTTVSPWEDEMAVLEYPIKSERDFDLIEEFMPPPYEVDISSIAEAIRCIGDDGIVSPSFHGPFNIICFGYRNLSDLLVDVVTSPDFYHRMMRYFLDRLKQYSSQMLRLPVPMLDIGANMANGIVVSPGFLVEHILPYENELADFLQDQGTAALYHNCGYAAHHLGAYNKLKHRLWGYLAPAPHGDVELKDAVAKVPPELILWGHVDQIEFLRQATPAAIDERVKYICEVMKPRGNYILGTTDYLETETPPENIRAFVNAGLRYGSYD